MTQTEIDISIIEEILNLTERMNLVLSRLKMKTMQQDEEVKEAVRQLKLLKKVIEIEENIQKCQLEISVQEYESIDMKNLISLDSDEDFEKFLTETD